MAAARSQLKRNRRPQARSIRKEAPKRHSSINTVSSTEYSHQLRSYPASGRQSTPTPTRINLLQKSRILQLEFDDGSRFDLSCEYLGVFSPSAETKVAAARDETVTGKETVNISRLTPVGNHAVRLHSDDGHDIGIYSWETLYTLGRNHERNWQDYMAQLRASDIQDQLGDMRGSATLRITCFGSLVDRLSRASEEIVVPSSVIDVRGLLSWLRERKGEWENALMEYRVRVTVNKQFATRETTISLGDEISITPISAA